MENRWCTACGQVFKPRPQSPRQAYCERAECQRARKRLWQRAKRKTDADYHQNQLAAQKAWREKNPAYWSNYRESHPEYTAENRNRQHVRNERRAAAPNEIAKGDASSCWPLQSGLFKLFQIEHGEMVPGRCWTVRLTLLPPPT